MVKIMAYSKKKEEKKTNRIDVDCVFGLENDLQVSKLSFYPINKNGLLAKCTAEINGALILDNILVKENGYVTLPSTSYEKDGEKHYKDIFYFIIKGLPKKFGDFVLETYKANC